MPVLLALLLAGIPPMPTAQSNPSMVREPQLPVTAATNEFLPPPKTPSCETREQEQVALQQQRNHQEMQCLPSLQAESRQHQP